MVRIATLTLALALVVHAISYDGYHDHDHHHDDNNGARVDVFTRGDGGYYCIKIPYLFITRTGALLAFGEARMHDCSDWAATDLVYKRSNDGGRTWGAMRILYTNSTSTSRVVIGNAAPVQDHATGRILVPFCRNNLQVLLTTSDDDGMTWSAPVNITGTMGEVVKRDWTWIGLGPPNAIQLTSGRIIVPSYHSLTPNDDGELSIHHIMYSDDHGATWALGGNFTYGHHYPNECSAVEIAPNKILINARGLITSRIGAISNDGGLTYDPPYLIKGLEQPMGGCQGSTIRHPSNGWLFYSGLAESNLISLRYNMSLYISRDDGNTWNVNQVIDTGPSAYSSLVVLPDSSVALLYERSNKTNLVFDPDYFTYLVVWTP